MWKGSNPKIEPLQHYSEMLGSASPRAFVLFSAKEKETVERGTGKIKRKAEVFFIIGPEGGFDQGEVEEGKERNSFL